jgi:hypothetical protein
MNLMLLACTIREMTRLLLLCSKNKVRNQTKAKKWEKTWTGIEYGVLLTELYQTSKIGFSSLQMNWCLNKNLKVLPEV